MGGVLTKNHWIKVNQNKSQNFWTCQFFDSTMNLVLRPRRVQLSTALGTLTQGFLGTNFPGAMIDLNDHELMDFLSECRRGMSGLMGRFCFYESLFTMVSGYELYKLTYMSVGVGFEVEDIMFEMKYDAMRPIL